MSQNKREMYSLFFFEKAIFEQKIVDFGTFSFNKTIMTNILSIRILRKIVFVVKDKVYIHALIKSIKSNGIVNVSFYATTTGRIKPC